MAPVCLLPLPHRRDRQGCSGSGSVEEPLGIGEALCQEEGRAEGTGRSCLGAEGLVPRIPGPHHSNSSVASSPVGGPRTSCPSPGTINILEPCVGFRPCYNELLSALTPPPLTLLPRPSGSRWLPFGGQSAVSIRSRGGHWRGRSDVGMARLSPSVIPRPLSPLRYHLPSVEEGRQWKPEPSDSLHHHPHQPSGSQNCHCQGDTGEPRAEASKGGLEKPLFCRGGFRRDVSKECLGDGVV